MLQPLFEAEPSCGGTHVICLRNVHLCSATIVNEPGAIEMREMERNRDEMRFLTYRLPQRSVAVLLCFHYDTDPASTVLHKITHRILSQAARMS